MGITGEENSVTEECIVSSGSNSVGYTHNKNVDMKMVSDHIKAMHKQNGYTGLAVRVLNEYKPFITRAEGLDNIAAVEKEDTKEREEAVRGIILNISM